MPTEMKKGGGRGPRHGCGRVPRRGRGRGRGRGREGGGRHIGKGSIQSAIKSLNYLKYGNDKLFIVLDQFLTKFNANVEKNSLSFFSQGEVRAMLDKAMALCGIPSSEAEFSFEMRFAVSVYVNYVLFRMYDFRHKKSRAKRIVKTRDGEESERLVTVYRANLVPTVAEILARVMLNEDLAGAVLEHYRSRNNASAKAEEATGAESGATATETEVDAAADAEVDAEVDADAAAAAEVDADAAAAAAAAASHTEEHTNLALEARERAACDAAETSSSSADKNQVSFGKTSGKAWGDYSSVDD